MSDNLTQLSTEQLLIAFRRLPRLPGGVNQREMQELERYLEEARRRDAEIMSIAEIMQVLDKEILWCEQHPDKAFHVEYRKGFINGLIQAKYLIVEGNHERTKIYQTP